MDSSRLRGFLKVHVFKGSFSLRKVSDDGNLKVFRSGSIIAACSSDTEVSRKAVLDYALSVRDSLYAPYLFQGLSEEETLKMIERRIFNIKEGGAYFL